MALQSIANRVRLVAGLAGCLLLAACGETSQESSAQLLGLAVAGELPIDIKTLPQSAAMPTDNALALSAHLALAWGGAQGNNQLITLSKLPDNSGYAAVLIIDGGQGDDSIRGYRYTLQLQQLPTGKWRVVRAGKSWRCWPERGHSSYGSTPCA